MSDVHAELIDQVRARVEALGYELVDLVRGGTTSRARLQVRIDRPDAAPGHGITVDECARVSRQLERWLDETDLLGPRYRLEVSSPGVERPIRWREHWVRFIGRDVHVTVPERGRLRAVIVRVDGDAVTLRPMGGDDEVTVPIAAARHATLAVDWDGLGIHIT